MAEKFVRNEKMSIKIDKFENQFGNFRLIPENFRGKP